jgi:L-ascorbate metabolism protein UlaG (beta-lactamase superfamily)
MDAGDTASVQSRDVLCRRTGVPEVPEVDDEAEVGTVDFGEELVVPIHWDAFSGNTERPGAFLDAALESGFDFHVLSLARMRPFRLGVS